MDFFNSLLGKEIRTSCRLQHSIRQGLGEYVAYPDVTTGLSFANSMQRLKDIPIEGKVWRLPRHTRLPDDLVINFNTIDHPLINGGKKMTVAALISKLEELEKMMEYTGVTIR